MPGNAELPPLTPSHHIMGMPLTVPRYTVDDLDHFAEVFQDFIDAD